MILGRVIGQAVSTHKRPQFAGATLLLVQPETPAGVAVGTTLLAFDSVGAGVSERVLVVIEGRAAGEALGQKMAPVDAAIIGIVDHVDAGDRGGAPWSWTKSRCARSCGRPSPGTWDRAPRWRRWPHLALESSRPPRMASGPLGSATRASISCDLPTRSSASSNPR